MNTTQDIKILSFIMAYILILVPFLIFYLTKTKLIKKALISIGRMTVQLILIGFFLTYLFKLHNNIVTSLWIFVMICFSSFSVISNTEVKFKRFFLPITIAILLTTSIVLPFFTGVVVDLPNILEPRYAIAIGGMLLGNSMKGNIIFINSFYKDVRRNEKRYHYLLSLGASRKEALLPFFRTGLKSAVGPTLATTATMGIVTLPGMMTGQILGGASPIVAIKYQIAIMLAIFSAMAISTTLSIIFSVYISFNKIGILDKTIYKTKS